MAGEWDGGWWSSWWRGGGGGGNDGRWQDDGGRGCGDAKGDDNDVAWRGMDTMLCLHHPMYKLYQGKHQATAVAVQRGNCLTW